MSSQITTEGDVRGAEGDRATPHARPRRGGAVGEAHWLAPYMQSAPIIQTNAQARVAKRRSVIGAQP